MNFQKTNNFIPIFITQPTILGINALKNLKNKKISKFDKSYFDLEIYNDETRLITKKNDIHLIDLALKLKKKSSLL